MKINNTNKQPQRPHDKRMIKEFLMHLAGEIQVAECARHDRPVPPALQQGVNQFRAKFGDLCFLPPEVDGEAGDAQEIDLEVGASRRLEQVRHVRAVIAILEDLKMGEV